MPKFQAGRDKTGGRPKGSRNKLSADFIAALAAEFDEHGADCIRIVRVEDPSTFLKIIGSILPRELEISTTTALQEIDDTALNALIEHVRLQLDGSSAKLIEHSPIGEPERREKAETDRE